MNFRMAGIVPSSTGFGSTAGPLVLRGEREGGYGMVASSFESVSYSLSECCVTSCSSSLLLRFGGLFATAVWRV